MTKVEAATVVINALRKTWPTVWEVAVKRAAQLSESRQAGKAGS